MGGSRGGGRGGRCSHRWCSRATLVHLYAAALAALVIPRAAVVIASIDVTASPAGGGVRAIAGVTSRPSSRWRPRSSRTATCRSRARLAAPGWLGSLRRRERCSAGRRGHRASPKGRKFCMFGSTVHSQNPGGRKDRSAIYRREIYRRETRPPRAILPCGTRITILTCNWPLRGRWPCRRVF